MRDVCAFTICARVRGCVCEKVHDVRACARLYKSAKKCESKRESACAFVGAHVCISAVIVYMRMYVFCGVVCCCCIRVSLTTAANAIKSI